MDHETESREAFLVALRNTQPIETKDAAIDLVIRAHALVTEGRSHDGSQVDYDDVISIASKPADKCDGRERILDNAMPATHIRSDHGSMAALYGDDILNDPACWMKKYAASPLIASVSQSLPSPANGKPAIHQLHSSERGHLAAILHHIGCRQRLKIRQQRKELKRLRRSSKVAQSEAQDLMHYTRYLETSLYDEMKDPSSSRASDTLRESGVMGAWVYSKPETNICEMCEDICGYSICKECRES